MLYNASMASSMCKHVFVPIFQFGLKSILDHEEALTILSRTVDPADPPTMLEAVRLLAAMCLVPPNGYIVNIVSVL